MTNAMSISAYLRSTKLIFGEMQLQKLLYYSQAWALAWTGRTLFADEIEAWSMGPVVREVWAAGKYTDYVAGDIAGLSPSEQEIVDVVYSFYGQNGGARLSTMTHAEAPWNEARGGLGPNAQSTAPVSQATMRRYYTRLLIEGKPAPKQPVRAGRADDAHFAAAGARQQRRWRGALDELAKR